MGQPVVIRAKPVRRYFGHTEFDEFCRKQYRRLKDAMRSSRRARTRRLEGELARWEDIMRDEVDVVRRK